MYIVTGGAGFLGSAFVAKLNAEGIDDIVIVDELADSEKWKNIRGKSFADYIHKDRFLEQLQQGHYHRSKASSAVDAIIHMGACSSTTEQDLDFLIRNNFYYTRELAHYAINHKIRFIYASSAATYGDGALGFSDEQAALSKLKSLNRYGYSKQLFDCWALRNNAFDKIVGLKFFNVFGPNEYHKGEQRSVIHKAFCQACDHGEVTLFKSYRKDYKDGEQKRDFVYVKDCSEVMWWLLKNQKVHGIYNLGTGQARTWLDLATAVFKALGKEAKIKFIEMPANIRQHYQYFSQADMAKLQKAGFTANFHSLEAGVTDYIQNYLSKDDPYL